MEQLKFWIRKKRKRESQKDQLAQILLNKRSTSALNRTSMISDINYERLFQQIYLLETMIIKCSLHQNHRLKLTLFFFINAKIIQQVLFIQSAMSFAITSTIIFCSEMRKQQLLQKFITFILLLLIIIMLIIKIIIKNNNFEIALIYVKLAFGLNLIPNKYNKSNFHTVLQENAIQQIKNDYQINKSMRLFQNQAIRIRQASNLQTRILTNMVYDQLSFYIKQIFCQNFLEFQETQNRWVMLFNKINVIDDHKQFIQLIAEFINSEINQYFLFLNQIRLEYKKQIQQASNSLNNLN